VFSTNLFDNKQVLCDLLAGSKVGSKYLTNSSQIVKRWLQADNERILTTFTKIH